MARWLSLIFLLAAPLAARATEPNPNFDSRLNDAARAESTAKPKPSAAATSSAALLASRVGDAYVNRDPVLGAPKFIASSNGFLTGPGGVGRAIPAARARGASAADPYGVLRDFLNEYRPIFSFGEEALAGARQTRDDVTPYSGVRTGVWMQELDGVGIFGAVLKASITKDGELVNVGSLFIADPAAAANRGVGERAAAVANPTVTPQAAITAAAVDLKISPFRGPGAAEAAPLGVDRYQRFAGGGRLNAATARLVWFARDAATLRISWEVLLEEKLSGRLYRTVIDALSGEAVFRQGLTNDLQDFQLTVFTGQSPTPMATGLTSPSTDQPAAVSRSTVSLADVNTTASPGGWIADNVNITSGNNANAHTNPGNTVPYDGTNATGSPNRIFNPSLDLAQAPASSADASVVQLFYWCNFMHDRLYELGFTETAGNFQTSNFNRGGNEGDAVQADALSSTNLPAVATSSSQTRNNANFSTPPDQTPYAFNPRMRMFIWDGQQYGANGSPIPNTDVLTPDRDGCYDATVVLHEYAHGLSSRLVGGGVVGINALQTQGMGEGWSDFYALCFLSKAGDDVDANYVCGGYVTKGFIGASNLRELLFWLPALPLQHVPGDQSTHV